MEVILDHNRKPRNFREMGEATHKARGHNPLCGDEVDVFLMVEEGVVKEVSFTGVGCAISKASASMMTQRVKNLKVEEAIEVFQASHHLLTLDKLEEGDGKKDGEKDGEEDVLKSLTVFEGVRAYPARVKCATLAWHTLREALNGNTQASTQHIGPDVEESS